MKAIILYKSYLGTTRTYAEWLRDELKCDLKKFGQVRDEELKGYDSVIITSGTYAARMPLVNFLKSKWEVIKDKNVVVVAVGIAPENVEYSRRSYERIPANIREKIKYFKIPGRIGFIRTAGEVKKENLDRIIRYIRSSGS
jgi:menaquinone-dependent protoporphyrinogen IX oxidase